MDSPSPTQALIPMTVSSYRFPPSGLPVNVRHRDGCPNSSPDAAGMLVSSVAKFGFSLTSEFEMIINGVLANQGCTDCHVLRDDTFGLFVRHHTPAESSFVPSSLFTPTQGTGSLVGEHLDTYAPFAASPATVVVKAGRTTPSPIHDLPSSERALYDKFTLDHSCDGDYHPGRSAPIGLFNASPMTRSGAKDLLWSRAPVPAPKDTAMSLGAGLTTEKDGLGDSVHASSPPHVDDVVDFVESTATDYGSMPVLPSTMACDGGDVGDVAQMALTSGQGAGAAGSVCSDDSMDDSDGSGSSDDVDPKIKKCLHMIDNLLIEVDLLSRCVLDLENDRTAQAETFNETLAKLKEFTPARVDAMATKRPIARAISRKDKGKGKAVDVPPAVSAAVPAAPSSSAAPRPAPTKSAPPPPVRPVAVVPARLVAGPSDIPPVAPVSSSWSAVAATSSEDKTFSIVSPRRGRRSPPRPGPSITARERHVAIRFEKRGSTVLLPAGVNTEMVKTALNKVFVARGLDARFGSCVSRRTTGDLFLDLVQHSSASIWELVPHLEVAAMGLGLNGFSFCQDTKKIKILISHLPLSPAGVRGSWEVADWQNDNSFDDLIRDLEVTNPGVHVVGRPHWIGSLARHKQYKHNQGSVVFVVDFSPEVRASLDHGSIMVYSRRRPVRIWAELKATSICDRCLRHGHVAVMCRAPVACKFCDGGHHSKQHSCPVCDCSAATGSLCTHVKLECRLCSRVGHLTGDPSCPDLRVSSPTSSPPRPDKMVSDETSPRGETDGSIRKVFPDPRQAQTENVIDEKIAAEAAAMKSAPRPHSNSII
ncbi:hypothetical protein L873DRAFT_1824442 [Choiromyces venosus 120613-1]|uniref:Uncharacterized protein n=1 Tax=Choiromyces venosus 120613-1 TaxID=1336337 RepID=A0A3N4IRY4_9PEZI|nr:hypothetical protein L873DRAFT_1824442 [Choiromyces venosus 120613-1]